MEPVHPEPNQITRNRLALERFENQEALYREGDLLARVRVTNIRVGRRGIAASIRALATPGFDVPERWWWQIGSIWSTFRFSAYTWKSVYYAPFQLDFRAESVTRIQNALLSLPPNVGQMLRRMVVSNLLNGPPALSARLLSSLTDESDRQVLDETSKQQAALHAKSFENHEAIYCTGNFVARIRVTDVTVDGRGIWAVATVIPTPSLGVALHPTDSWKVGGCWPCLYVRKDAWTTSCADPVIVLFDAEKVNRIIEIANRELAMTDGGAHTEWLAEFIWTQDERQLAERAKIVRRARESCPLQNVLPSSSIELRKYREDSGVTIKALGYPFEVD